MGSISTQTKHAIAERCLADAFRTYAGPSMEFLTHEPDPFRNPVGTALREGIPILVSELFGDMDADTISRALEGIVRIRAVQNFSASQAVGFVFILKTAWRAEMSAASEGEVDLDHRIDEIALTAFDLFMRCREQIYEVRLREDRRKTGLLERIYSGVEGR
jgi:RsbT co-antagonist protein rsbRD N-terminal domain